VSASPRVTAHVFDLFTASQRTVERGQPDSVWPVRRAQSVNLHGGTVEAKKQVFKQAANSCEPPHRDESAQAHAHITPEPGRETPRRIGRHRRQSGRAESLAMLLRSRVTMCRSPMMVQAVSPSGSTPSRSACSSTSDCRYGWYEVAKRLPSHDRSGRTVLFADGLWSTGGSRALHGRPAVITLGKPVATRAGRLLRER